MVLAGGANAKERRTFDCRIGESVWLKFTSMKLTASEKGIQTKAPLPGLAMRKKPSKKTNSTAALRQRKRVITSKRQQYPQFAVCINNEGYKASLELGKLYRIVPDKQAQTHQLVRVIDESGEDYAYAANRFHSMKVSSVVEKALSDSQRSIPKSIRVSRP